MGQLDDVQVKGQNLSRMNLIVKRIEGELAQLKNLINEQIQSLTASTATNCDGYPDPDGNPGDSSIIDDGSYCLVDSLKTENDLITITAENIDYDDVVNNYQEKFNEVRVNSQNRPSNVDEELILGGVNFNFEVSSKKDKGHDLNPQSSYHTKAKVDISDKVIIRKGHEDSFVDLIEMSNETENLDGNLKKSAGTNDLKLNQKLIVQMGVRCQQNPIILQSNRTIDQVSQSKNKNQKDIKTLRISSKRKRPKGSVKKSHICSTCSKSCQSFIDLTRHMRIHTGERPFKCKFCSKSFTLKANLKTHSRSHTGEKPYSCSICSKSFSYNQSRNDHMRIHTGERPFSCSVCLKTFTHSTGLRTHRMVHTGSTENCSKCQGTFHRPYVLKKHMLKPIGQNPHTNLYKLQEKFSN